jgi:hypothetical protein
MSELAVSQDFNPIHTGAQRRRAEVYSRIGIGPRVVSAQPDNDGLPEEGSAAPAGGCVRVFDDPGHDPSILFIGSRLQTLEDAVDERPYPWMHPRTHKACPPRVAYAGRCGIGPGSSP